MFIVKDFRKLICYKKAIFLLENLEQEITIEEDRNKIQFIISKICGYIAKSNGNSLYVNEAKKNLNKALKWTNILEKTLKNIKYENIKFENEIKEIRKILIGLRKKWR